jgi:Spy/CpxP family protein refolding chaperone
MKYFKLFPVLLTTLLVLSSLSFGQDGPPPGEGPHDDHADGRPNLFSELGLTSEQIQQIRRMNQERRPAMMHAQHRMREANRALDMAIYADTVSDADFQTSLTEFRSAQSELARLRFEGELAVRKILSPEQLVRFRDLRRKFAEARQSNIRNRRMRRGRVGPPPLHDGPRDKPPIN